MKNYNLLLISAFLISQAFPVLSQHGLDSLPPQNWYLQNVKETGIAGASVERAYSLLEGKTATEVVVAVLDGGTDIEHEDLKANIWVNIDEIPDNGIDDDNNGYIDDVHGWSFIGGPEGDVHHDNLEFTRVYKSLKQRFEGKGKRDIARKDKKDYKRYLEMQEEYDKRVEKSEKEWQEFQQIVSFYELSKQTAEQITGKVDFKLEDIQAIDAENEFIAAVKEFLTFTLETGFESEIEEGIEHYQGALKYGYDLKFDPRYIVGDDYSNKTEKYYGNNHVAGPDATHGTHVAGIIGALRNNGLGVNGACEMVKLMPVRCVPQGDERDKDVANAIYYAVDNGAHIVNMSFGKSYSPDKEIVDAAVKYAEEKGVLMIHAAGNSNRNNDKSENFPNPVYEDTRELCTTWIEVGASSWQKRPDFVASFSNYGKKSVDIFAPGADIYNTTPGDHYEYLSGTSMASPLVAGIAALIKSYYPELTGKDLRNVILNSYDDYGDVECTKPGTGSELVKFKKLCRTGGVINAFNAIKMAEEFSQKKAEKDAK